MSCEVNTHPAPFSYIWFFNTTSRHMTIPEDHVTSFGNKSYVSYTPKARKDFGSLLCWAENVIGKQIIPCVFQVNNK